MKTKVAPVKKQTIPRLELIGATLLARLVNSLLTTVECGNILLGPLDDNASLDTKRSNLEAIRAT